MEIAMDIVNSFQTFLLYACVGMLGAVSLLWLAVLACGSAKRLASRMKKAGRLNALLSLLAVAMMVAYGGSKPPLTVVSDLSLTLGEGVDRVSLTIGDDEYEVTSSTNFWTYVSQEVTLTDISYSSGYTEGKTTVTGLTGENPTLIAFVADESGINTTGAGIGHDIMATLSGPSKNSYCLNDYFVSEVDDPGKGTITYKMQDLADGDYTLTLKVWDIYNNSNTASIDFTVVHSDGMVVEHPANWPNPVADETFFTFDHNQVGNNMKVEIQIFDIMGRWVTTLSETVSGSSTRVAPIRWNGRSSNGATLRNGVYVYRIIATNDKGESSTLVSKLVLAK
jgi:hypothetical protein